MGSIAHRHEAEVLRLPQGALARVGFGNTVRRHLFTTPSAPLAGTSRFHRSAAYTRCLRCAGAPKRPRAVPGFRCAFCAGIPLFDHGEFDFAKFQDDDVDGLRRGRTARHSKTPQSVSRGAMNFAALRTHICYIASLLALWNGSDQILQPSRASTSRLSAGRSPFLPLDMTTTATGLLVSGFFCQEVSAERPIFLPSLVSLFDLKARFFVSDRRSRRAPGAVKAGRLLRRTTTRRSLALTVPSTLSAPSNAGGLGQQDDDQRGAPAFERGSIAPQPCIRWGPRTRTMMQSCASVRSSEAADPFSVTA